MIRNADAALYHAKKSGGNVHSYYKSEMNEAAVERLMTKSKLKRAFERDELLVHYQPKYNLQTGIHETLRQYEKKRVRKFKAQSTVNSRTLML